VSLECEATASYMVFQTCPETISITQAKAGLCFLGPMGRQYSIAPSLKAHRSCRICFALPSLHFFVFSSSHGRIRSQVN
jgi:hypothetical protein